VPRSDGGEALLRDAQHELVLFGAPLRARAAAHSLALSALALSALILSSLDLRTRALASLSPARLLFGDTATLQE
jgi:hypothetical protein